MKLLLIVIMLLAVFTFNGCKNKTVLNDNGVPDKLVMGLFGGENPGSTQKIWEPIRKCMEKDLGIPVEVLITNDYTAVIEAIHTKKIHIAELGPFSYIIAAQNKDIEPFAVLGVKGQPHMYHSTIFARTNSGINTIADLKSRAKNLTFCFTDPASTSGHLIPRAYLSSIGLDPDTAFKETIFAGSHAASVLTVAAGKIDVGCATDEYGVDMLIKRGLVKKGELKILWVSDPIIGSPLVIRKDIDKRLARRIQQFYLNLAKDHLSIFNDYIKVYYAHPPADLAYVPIADSMFNGIRKIAGGVKDLKLVN
jgi:phosphonate transport system substrate-binding protein